MKKYGLKIIGLSVLMLALTALVIPRRARAQLIAIPVTDIEHTLLNRTQWGLQLAKMREQIQKQLKRIEQWDEDFTKLWGKRGGRIHDVLRTAEQVTYARQRPWGDILSTSERIYTDLNQTTRDPRSGFGAVKAVRDHFTFIRPDIDRYRNLAPGVKDYYRALGNLSSEGLYVSARTYNAGHKLWNDAEELNKYARDTSPVGMAKTQAFAASVGVYAQGYQLETLNRILRQISYLNMKQENAERMAIMATGSLQEAMSNMYSDVPIKTHLID